MYVYMYVGYISIVAVVAYNGIIYRLSPFIHSFITEIYIAPLQGYYSEALPTLTAKKKSFETRVECVRKNPGEQSLMNSHYANRLTCYRCLYFVIRSSCGCGVLCYMVICIAPLRGALSVTGRRKEVFELLRDAGNILCSIILRSE